MKKLIKNPFFIAAISITVIGIIALVIYLVKKKKNPQLPNAILNTNSNSSQQLPANNGGTTQPISTDAVKVANNEVIRLTTPYQRSSKIKRLQKGLNKRGYHLAEDGIYGEKTHEAAMGEYPNFLSDGQIAPNELIVMLDAASAYDSTFAWTRPAISKTGESIASIIQGSSMDLNYDGTTDAQLIQDALSFWNDDEEAIKKVFYRLTKSQIAQLLVSFQSLYGQPLDEYLKGGLLWGLDDTEYDEILSIVRSRA